MLKRCDFPGNVRELENSVRRTATLAGGAAITKDDLSCASGECLSSVLWTGHSRGAFSDPIEDLAWGRTIAAPTPERAAPPRPANARLTEKDRLIDALEHTGWVQAKAARVLSFTPRQIGYALRKYHIDMKRF